MMLRKWLYPIVLCLSPIAAVAQAPVVMKLPDTCSGTTTEVYLQVGIAEPASSVGQLPGLYRCNSFGQWVFTPPISAADFVAMNGAVLLAPTADQIVIGPHGLFLSDPGAKLGIGTTTPAARLLMLLEMSIYPAFSLLALILGFSVPGLGRPNWVIPVILTMASWLSEISGFKQAQQRCLLTVSRVSMVLDFGLLLMELEIINLRFPLRASPSYFLVAS